MPKNVASSFLHHSGRTEIIWLCSRRFGQELHHGWMDKMLMMIAQWEKTILQWTRILDGSLILQFLDYEINAVMQKKINGDTV